MTSNYTAKNNMLITALNVGALLGIFEATFGYILHLLPINIGFLFWYPVACFFLMKSYKATAKPSAILITVALASSVKLLNLVLPVRVDKVINPAVSIVFEGVAIWIVIVAFQRLNSRIQKKSRVTTITAVFISNSLWRLLFIAYIAVIVPEWIYDISVLRNTDALFRFLIIENLTSSIVAFLGLQILSRTKDVKIPVFKVSAKLSTGLLMVLNIALQFLLR